MKKSLELDKDPNEYFIDYARKYGEEKYREEIPYLLWGVEDIALDVKQCLEADRTLSEMFPDKYPLKVEDDVDI